jgi:hypothetical protein
MKKQTYLMSLLMITLIIPGISVSGQGKTDNKSIISSFDEGWRFIKANPAGA